MRVLVIVLFMFGAALAAADPQTAASEPATQTPAPDATPQQVVVENPGAEQKTKDTPAPSTSDTTATATARNAANASDAKLVKSGKLNLDVNQAMKVFVPTEQIDVDKPVDFPTNI
ncbi:MAG TPA: hypothetical protein VJ998_02010 [Pseudomonadales bacterium]|nr:hypothetical protein [Pseudomonadales bacterium]